MFRITLLVAIVLTFSNLYGQTSDADSVLVAGMRNELANIRSISKKNLDSAFTSLERVRSDFENAGDPNLSVEFLLLKSWLLLKTEAHDSIITILKPVVAEPMEVSLYNRASAYQHIGHAYKMKWVPDSALVNYIRALKAYEKDQNQRGLSLSYLAMGLTYDKLENEEMANYFFEKSMEYSTNSEIIEKHKEHITNQDARPVSYNRTIELSLDIAKIAQEQDNDRLLMVTYSDLKKNYFDIENYDKALEYANKEMQLRDKTASYVLLPEANAFVASIYVLQNKPDQATEKYKEALTGAPDSLKLSIYQNLKNIYDAKGDSRASLEVLEKYVALKDSVNSRETEASIARVMAQFQTELQEEQIKSLNYQNELNTTKIEKQRTTLFGIIGGSALLLVLGFLGYRNYKTRQELSHSQLNFKLLQTQMNPHFMFNALNEINASLDSDTSERSSQYLTSYSKLMRTILQSSSQEFVPLAEDIALISKFLELQQLVHNHEFTFDVSVSEELDTHFIRIPPMLTQPYVENAVLHGVKGVSEGHIAVTYRLINDQVHIEISDNGKGINRKTNQSGNELHTSMGTNIIAQRIETYKKLHDYEIAAQINSEVNQGTTVVLDFPLKLGAVV